MMSGEAGDLEDADGSGLPAWSADVEECSTWCLDGLDGRDWLTPVTLVAHPCVRLGTRSYSRGRLSRTGTGFLSPTASNVPARSRAAGRSGQGEPHLVPGHAPMVRGGQPLVGEAEARVEGNEVIEAGEHQTPAAVGARRLDDGAQ